MIRTIENKDYRIIDKRSITKTWTKTGIFDRKTDWTYEKTYWHVDVQMVNPYENRERTFVLSQMEYDEIFSA